MRGNWRKKIVIREEVLTEQVLFLHHNVVDHGDGKFLGTMECQWFSSRYHCGQWFFNGFFTSEPSLSMVFHISTIGINGFSNGFSISDDGFSMVFYR